MTQAQPRPKLRSLEALRGLAALSILLHHTATQLVLHPSSPVKDFHGGLQFPQVPGIELFFVISGFSMMLAHGGDFGRAERIPRFLWNRAARIYPLYWLALFELLRRIALPDWHTLIPPSFSTREYASWFSLVPIRTPDLIPVAWTLRFEIGFYVMFALCLLPRVGMAIMAAWLTLTVTCSALGRPPPQALSCVLDPFTVDFFAGLAAGWCFRRAPVRAGAAGLIAAAGLIVAALRLPHEAWGFMPGPDGARAIYGAAYGMILFGLSRLEAAGRLRLGVWAALMGLASYPLYVTHVTVLDYGIRLLAVTGLPRRNGADLAFALLVLGSVAVALAVGVLIDQPLQRALRWRGRRALQAPEPALTPP